MPKGVYKRTEYHNKINSKGHIGQKSWNKGKKFPQFSGINSHRFGKHHTKEAKDKLSKKHKGMKKPWAGKYKHSELQNKNISNALKGIKRSKEFCEKLRIANIGKKITEETRQKLIKSHMGILHTETTKRKISQTLTGKIPPNNDGNFRNIKRGWYNINGKKMFFRSKWEVNYALYLDFLVKQKQIKQWWYEKDVFIFDKIKFGTRSYRPDFKIENYNLTIEYHEVKGWMDNGSKTKIKRMAKYYPHIKLIIIDSPIYQDIVKKVGKLLKFY